MNGRRVFDVRRKQVIALLSNEAIGLAVVDFALQLIVAVDERFERLLNLGDAELEIFNLRGRGVERVREPC